MKYGEGVMGSGKISKAKIGIFDSNLNGLSTARAIQKALPDYEVVYATDKIHIPYGTKTAQQIYDDILPILQALADQGCKVIVVEGETIPINIINTLRQQLKSLIINMGSMANHQGPKIDNASLEDIVQAAQQASAQRSRD